MLGEQLTVLGIDGITMRIMIESILVRRAVCENICLNNFNSMGQIGFLKYVSITLIDVTDGKNPKMKED